MLKAFIYRPRAHFKNRARIIISNKRPTYAVLKPGGGRIAALVRARTSISGPVRPVWFIGF